MKRFVTGLVVALLAAASVPVVADATPVVSTGQPVAAVSGHGAMTVARHHRFRRGFRRRGFWRIDYQAPVGAVTPTPVV